MGSTSGETTEAARKRLAVEIVARHERALKQTARRYSLCAADAEDAYQRALEILLTKAPTGDPRELVRWMQTVTKHEALAARRNRERLLSGTPASSGEDDDDWVALIPAPTDGPAERAERHEAVARSREALQALKPAELRALTLLAEGYSYAEISQLTGFSPTKVNRCLAEGRERFRSLLMRSQDGSRCEELRPLLSAFCDGEASPKEVAAVREHLRACAPCRAAMRAYKAAPGAAAALVPGLPLVSQSLFDRLREAFGELQARLPTRGGAESASQAATSAAVGSGGSAALTKAIGVCVTAVGGTAACVAVGIVPAPLDFTASTAPPPIERRVGQSPAAAARSGPAETARPRTRKPEPKRHDRKQANRAAEAAPSDVSTEPAQAVAVEPEPAPAPESEPAPEAAPAPEPAPLPAASAGGGGAAGEFGP